MNIANNKRKKESQLKFEKAFAELIQKKELNQISVTEICKLTHLNRTTFYANYLDIDDLADKFREKLENDMKEVYKEEREKAHNSNDFLKLFKHIKENQLFYKTYFKLNVKELPITEYDYNLANILFQDKYIDYHIEFFKAGLNAIILKWLNNDCKESPETINEIITSEYKSKSNIDDILKNKITG